MADRTWHENRYIFIRSTDRFYEQDADGPAMSDVLSNLSFYSARTQSTVSTVTIALGSPPPWNSWQPPALEPVRGFHDSNVSESRSDPSYLRDSQRDNLTYDEPASPSRSALVTRDQTIIQPIRLPSSRNGLDRAVVRTRLTHNRVPTGSNEANDNFILQNTSERTTFGASVTSNSNDVDDNESNSHAQTCDAAVDGPTSTPSRTRTQCERGNDVSSHLCVSPSTPRTIGDITEVEAAPARVHTRTQWKRQPGPTSQDGISPVPPRTISDITGADDEGQQDLSETPTRPRTKWKKRPGAAVLFGASPRTPRTVSNITGFNDQIGPTEDAGGATDVSNHSASSVVQITPAPVTPIRTPTGRAGNWDDPDVLGYMSPQTCRRRGEAIQPLNIIQGLQEDSDADTIGPDSPTSRLQVRQPSTGHGGARTGTPFLQSNSGGGTAIGSDLWAEQDESAKPYQDVSASELDQNREATSSETSSQAARFLASIDRRVGFPGAPEDESSVEDSDADTRASAEDGEVPMAEDDGTETFNLLGHENRPEIGNRSYREWLSVHDISEPDVSGFSPPGNSVVDSVPSIQSGSTPTEFVPFPAPQHGHLGQAYIGENVLGEHCVWATHIGWHHVIPCPHRCSSEIGLHVLRCGCEVYLAPGTPCSVRCAHYVPGELRNGRAPACPCVPAGCYTQFLAWVEDTEIIEWAWRVVYHGRGDLFAEVGRRQRDVFLSFPKDIQELLPPRAEWGEKVNMTDAVTELQRRHEISEQSFREQRQNIALDEWEYSSIYPPETSDQQTPPEPVRAGLEADGDSIMSLSDDDQPQHYGYDPRLIAAGSEALRAIVDPLITSQALRTAIPASTLALLESEEAGEKFKDSLREFIMAEVHREIQIQGPRLVNDQVLYRHTTQQVLNRCCREARAVLLARRTDDRRDMRLRKIYLWQRIDQLCRKSGGYFDHHWLNSKAVNDYNYDVQDGKWYNLDQADLEDLLHDMDPDKTMLNCLIFKGARVWELDGRAHGRTHGWQRRRCTRSRESPERISGIGLVKQYEKWLGRPLKTWMTFLQRLVWCQVTYLEDPEHPKYKGANLFAAYEAVIWERNLAEMAGECEDNGSELPDWLAGY